jgi:hypothetical protein
MPSTWPNTGKILALDDITAAGTIEINLYISVAPPVDRNTTPGDFATPTYAGYAPQNATGWTPAAINAAFKAESQADPLTFTAAGSDPGNMVLGAYYTGPGGDILKVDPFATGPVDMETLGNTFQFIPVMTTSSEFNN